MKRRAKIRRLAMPSHLFSRFSYRSVLMRDLKFLRFFSLPLIFTAFCAASAISQTATPTPKPKVDDEIIKIESRLVVVPVSVTDPNGNPVLGLSSADFRVLEEGRQQTLDAVNGADKVPLEIALLFDVSATTSPMFRFQQETAAKFLKDVMRPEDRATIFTIGEKAILVQPRDTAEKSVASIQSIQSTKGFTAFFDTVVAASDFLKRNSPENSRRVIVVISDGEDTNSERVAKAIQDGYRKMGEQLNTLDQKTRYALTVNNRNQAGVAERIRVLRILQNSDTVFYSINPAGSSYHLNTMSVFGQENMKKFAEDTGGTAFLPKFLPIDTKDGYANAANSRRNGELLDRIFRQLASELRSQYLIQYYSESDFPINKFVKLDVGVPTRTDVRVRAREGYYVKN
jgi:Ca-activated chloride channel family protein